MFVRFVVLLLLCVNLTTYISNANASKAGATKGNEKGVTIGIDLGTTYSVAGVLRNGRIEIIPNDQGNRITPSYVAYTAEGERLIGDAAKNQLTSNPTNTLFDIKRFIGREWSDPIVQANIKKYPFKIVEHNKRPGFEVNTNLGPRILVAEEISAMVLQKMKQSAEVYLGVSVDNAVITVPAYFNDAQRKATKSAGRIAGLNVTRIINEPTAAGLAYKLDDLDFQQRTTEELTFLIFDLGGGTFDVSVLTIEKGVYTVEATNGDTNLGGEDFDHRIVDYLLKLFKAESGIDISKDNKALQKLRREAEKAKRTLSTYKSARIEIDSLAQGKDFVATLKREKFEELNMDLFESTIVVVKKVLQDADKNPSNIDDVLLVGGSTRIPMIRQLLEKEFGKPPNSLMNADEAVAFGATVQAGIISKELILQNLVLLDVNPLTLGIESVGGIMSPIIRRNSVIPSKKSETFTTNVDNQEAVNIQVFEGERKMTEDNHLLGKFVLDGISPAPKNIPKIEVTFRIDVDGILQVTATDLGRHGAAGTITKTITNKHNRLNDQDILKMTKDAAQFANEDQIKVENANARNELESYIYDLRYHHVRNNAGVGALLDEDDKQELEEAIDELIQWLQDNPKANKFQYKGKLMQIEGLAEKIVGRINAKFDRAFILNATTSSHDEL